MAIYNAIIHVRIGPIVWEIYGQYMYVINDHPIPSLVAMYVTVFCTFVEFLTVLQNMVIWLFPYLAFGQHNVIDSLWSNSERGCSMQEIGLPDTMQSVT